MFNKTLAMAFVLYSAYWVSQDAFDHACWALL